MDGNLAGNCFPQPALARQFGHPARQKAPFGLLLGQFERPLVGKSRLRCPPESTAQIGTGRMREMGTIDLTACQQRIY